MTEASLLQRIYIRLGGEEKSGLIKPVVLAHVPTAIRRITKMIAAQKPEDHEKLLTEQSILNNQITTRLGLTYSQFSFSSFTNPIIADEKFHAAILKENVDGNHWEMNPVMTLGGLSMASTHGVVCYFIDYPYVYIAYPSSVADIDRLYITHYTYLPLTSFPEELEDYLIDDLIELLAVERKDDK